VSETFMHQVSAWTAGQLRAALEGIPDDWPVRVVTAAEPGSVMDGPDQVVIEAGPVVSEHAADDCFEIGCEFETGEYPRRAAR
jgi:hypothetical protein